MVTIKTVISLTGNRRCKEEDRTQKKEVTSSIAMFINIVICITVGKPHHPCQQAHHSHRKLKEEESAKKGQEEEKGKKAEGLSTIIGPIVTPQSLTVFNHQPRRLILETRANPGRQSELAKNILISRIIRSRATIKNQVHIN